jgi:prevent-host-death family protein
MAKYLKEIQEKGNYLIITQNGKPAGALLSPAEFDELMQTRLFIESISRGLLDSVDRKIFQHQTLKKNCKRCAQPNRSLYFKRQPSYS